MSTRDFDGFETTYRSHVEKVRAGDLKSVMTDMDPASLATVFDGVTVPREKVNFAEVLAVRLDGERGVGEAVYTTAEGRIGLRSGWAHDGSEWKADSLENFEATP